ncbi:helix-turn-helix transcriptional regulator [Clostridium sp.]|uniref:helix-turn-helix transcriptional regulator n=1 Tax=Clostridium sp. TaxID=1506 RepID=UPI0039909F48
MANTMVNLSNLEKEACNFVIDVINENPSWTNKKIIKETNKAYFNIPDKKIEIIYKIAKNRWMNNQGKFTIQVEPKKEETMAVKKSKPGEMRIKVEELIKVGKSNVEIAKTLNISSATVAYHKKALTTPSKPNKSNDLSYISKIALEVAELVNRKNHDYGKSFDKSVDKYGAAAYFLRIADKISRAETLSNKDALVLDEKIEDTLKDIIGYTLLYINYLNDKGVAN